MLYANETFKTETHMCIGSVRVRRLDPLTTRIKSLSNETLKTLRGKLIRLFKIKTRLTSNSTFVKLVNILFLFKYKTNLIS